MIRCPNCLNREMIGAIFCAECGAQLVNNSNTSTFTLQRRVGSQTHTATEHPTSQPEGLSFPPPTQGATLSLNIVSSGEIIPIHEHNEVTLGRVSKGASVVPDIDLSPYKAYESGVSRMHVSIQVSEDRITVADLGSVNGTRINGRKIFPNKPHAVKNGDILTLGKLKIQVILKN